MASFDETFDFVVAGSGGGSMCAGLVMRQAGKSVLILEKTPLIGGATARSGGVMWIPNNRFMKQEGVEDSFDKAMTYLDSVAGNQADAPGATRERRETYVREAPQMIEFLIGQGIELRRISRWPDYYDDLPGGSPDGRTVIAKLFDANELGAWKTKLRPGMVDAAAYVDEGMLIRTFKVASIGKRMLAKIVLRTLFTRLTGKHYLNAGAALQGRMLNAAVKAGVDIRVDSPVDELILENGVVVGVATQKDGKPWRVGARLGVLVNAGGFARNQAMRDQYQPGTRAEWSNVPEGDTGEMIQEMMRQGAATAQLEEFVGFQATLPPGTEDGVIKPGVQASLASPHAMLIDQSGVRYQNEGGSYMAFCKGMLARHKTVPAVPSWGLFDSQFTRRYFMPGTGMPGQKTPERWFSENYYRKADTLEALARKIDVDPATLLATVERFNGFVAKNHDDDFKRGDRAYDNWLGDPTHQPSNTLGTIAEGPFYAIPVVPGDVGTYGGAVTDVDARVLRPDGSVIPGLYATGVSTASVMGRVYPGAGCSVGPAFTFGYIAAHHALKAGAEAAQTA